MPRASPDPVGAGHRACPEPEFTLSPSKGRGGPRPGAGAKPGNLNALKTGRRSAQLSALAAALAELPEVRDLFLRLACREARRRRQAQIVARALFARFFPWAVPSRNGSSPPLTLSLSKGPWAPSASTNHQTIRHDPQSPQPLNAQKNAKTIKGQS